MKLRRYKVEVKSVKRKDIKRQIKRYDYQSIFGVIFIFLKYKAQAEIKIERYLTIDDLSITRWI